MSGLLAMMSHERFPDIADGAESAELANVIATQTIVCGVCPDLATKCGEWHFSQMIKTVGG
jgi:hypothetical protein